MYSLNDVFRHNQRMWVIEKFTHNATRMVAHTVDNEAFLRTRFVVKPENVNPKDRPAQ